MTSSRSNHPFEYLNFRSVAARYEESRGNKFHDQYFEVVHKCQRHSVLNSVFGKKDCFTTNKSAM